MLKRKFLEFAEIAAKVEVSAVWPALMGAGIEFALQRGATLEQIRARVNELLDGSAEPPAPVN
jgi:hypothetical protein